MSFKNFLNEEFVFKTPKPYKNEININIQKYYALINKSKLKLDKKNICENLLSQKNDIPVYCEQNNKFFMLSLLTKKSREVKSREDKQMCGALYNAIMIEEIENNNQEKLDLLKNIKINWEMPNILVNKI